MTVNPISSSHISQANEAAKPAALKPQQPQQSPQKSSPLPSDTVTLKSPGGVDHDGGCH